MILEAVNAIMESLDLPYMYWEYEFNGDEPPLYFVGERIESPATSEDGKRSGQFIISGWSRANLSPLLSADAAIRRAMFETIRASGHSGCAVIEYSHSSDIPSDVEGLCRMEIYLNYNEWSVS